MYIKDLKKRRRVHLNNEITNFDSLPKNNVLLIDYLNITYDIDLQYSEDHQAIIIKGKINFKVLVTDARDGEQVVHEQSVPWEESYKLSDLDGEQLNVDLLVSIQINANIPMNLSKNHGTITKTGPGWSVMSEDEYEKEKSEKPDHRLDKLKDSLEKKK